MRAVSRHQSGRKSKIPKHRLHNTSRKSKPLKTQKGGSVEADMLYSIMQQLDAYPLVQQLINKIFADGNIKYFKLDGSMPDPFIKLVDNPNFTPSFYLDWYKSKNPDFKTHAVMESENFDFNTNIGINNMGLQESDSIYETAMAQICRDILIMLQTKRRNMNNNARTDTIEFFTKQKQKIQNIIKEYSNIPKDQMIPIKTKTYNKSTKQLPLVNAALIQLEHLKTSGSTNNHQVSKSRDAINLAKNSLEMQTEKDLVIDNISDLTTLLSQCDICIKGGYKYKDVFEIIMDYILWLCTRSKPSIQFTPEKLAKYREQLKQTPFLILPTYAQISYKYVLCMMASPIINFRFINRKRIVHGFMSNSFEELDHDIMFHGNISHKIEKLNSDTYQTWFTNMSIIISTLFQYFNYTKLVDIKEEIEKEKQIIAIILFIFLHEDEQKFIYYLYFNTDLTKLKYPRTMEDLYSVIEKDEEWIKFLSNTIAKSAIITLNLKFNAHRNELNEPMGKLAKILGLEIPEIQEIPQ